MSATLGDFEIEADLLDPIETTTTNVGQQPKSARGTLDESIRSTLKRDVDNIHARLREVVYPHFPMGIWAGRETNSQIYKHNTDLWAPLVFVILNSLIMSNSQHSLFSSVFVLNWAVIAVIATHIKLIHTGESISWLAYVSMGGYCMFPLVLNSLLNVVCYPLLLRLFLSGAWELRVLYLVRIFSIILFSLWAYASICAVSRCQGFAERYPLGMCLFGLGILSMTLSSAH
ncbi:HCL279Wp [Eremothecium sinecaudum]|uniref:HCL279Wp n=1 Tax=Eremothecium sinecaudum TaxID=45286 RepID=A0A109UYW5_9SACH|nr:HCL279Wp [Eremothecium sinecaudum]AMD19872.1 HCL279Wp [Eremothecium sinecaudum]